MLKIVSDQVVPILRYGGQRCEAAVVADYFEFGCVVTDEAAGHVDGMTFGVRG